MALFADDVCQPLIHPSLSLGPRVIPLAAARKAVAKGTTFGNLLLRHVLQTRAKGMRWGPGGLSPEAAGPEAP